MTPSYRFLTDLGDRGGEIAIISIRRAALAIRAEKILIARAENDAPLADVHGNSQSSSGNKDKTNSYRACKSRARKRGWGQLGGRRSIYTPC